MIKRVLAALTLMISLCSTAFANHEVSVKLTRDNKIHVAKVEGLAYVTFEYVRPEGHNARVRVMVENLTYDPPFAILMFRTDMEERFLKQYKPKIEFEKTYPGEKGKRRVYGTHEGYDKYRQIIAPNEVDTLFTIDVAMTSPRSLKLPLYIAKYNPQNLKKKGKLLTKYKILKEIILEVDIEVEGWSRDDATYVSMKSKVDQYIASLRGVAFCPNARHPQSLYDQQRPYMESRQGLISEIYGILQSNTDWMSQDPPHIAYTELLDELQKVNLDNHVSDCGNDPLPPPPSSSRCRYCSLSAQEVYHQLDDTFQRLHARRITKQEALKTANALNNCYQNHHGRSKDRFYGGKISEYYKRIANY